MFENLSIRPWFEYFPFEIKLNLTWLCLVCFICFIFDKECSRNEISVIKIPLWTLKKKHNSSCHDSLWSPMVKDVFIVVQLVSHVQLFGLQHARFLCPPLSPRVCWNSCVLSLWCCLLITISKMSSRSESRILWLS